jgi:hypothetical protein
MNNFEGQLDVIRAELYEETKNMTNADAARFVNETARHIFLALELLRNSFIAPKKRRKQPKRYVQFF